MFVFALDEHKKTVYVDSNKLSYTLNDNLTHFTSYNIELYVCREWSSDEEQGSSDAANSLNPQITNCSLQKAMTTAKTSKKGKHSS